MLFSGLRLGLGLGLGWGWGWGRVGVEGVCVWGGGGSSEQQAVAQLLVTNRPRSAAV